MYVNIGFDSSNGHVNPHQSFNDPDTRLCRPYRIALEKEDEEAIQKEFNRIKAEIEALQDYSFVSSNGSMVNVTFECYTCGFDGKCVNRIINNRATSRCPVCLKTAHQFNKYNNIKVDFMPMTDAMYKNIIIPFFTW